MPVVHLAIHSSMSFLVSQNWFLSKTGEVRRDEGCFDYAGQYAMIYSCHGMQGNQLWSYNMVRRFNFSNI